MNHRGRNILNLLALGILIASSACQIKRPGLDVGPNGVTAKFLHTGTEPSCSVCHESKRPVTTPAHGGGSDCVSCHVAGGLWTTLKSGTAFSHNPLPETCNGCHMNKKPVGPVPLASTRQFDHAVPGLPDCKSCHSQSAGVSWAGGIYSHTSPVPSQNCNLCHVADRPSVVVSWLQNGVPRAFDHTDYRGSDCSSCHTGYVSWASGNYSHNPKPGTCYTCHVDNRPTTPVGGFDHSIAGTGECALCHWQSGPTPTFQNGNFSHSTLASTVRCDSCHASQKPLAGDLRPPSPAVNQMDHAIAGLPDCRSCHSAHIGTAWNDGVFHSKFPNPASCANCHMNKRPTSVVNGFDHSVNGTGDCMGCHTQPGVTWAGATVMPHPASGLTAGSTLACATCHGQGGLASLKLTVPASSHMGGTGNSCISCHANFSAFKGATTSTTAPILKYAHTNATAPSNNCMTCHNFVSGTFNSFSTPSWTFSQTTNVTASHNGTTKTQPHTNTNLSSNCMACHSYVAYSATANTAQLRWKFSHDPRNPGVTNTRNSVGCKLCH